jgi:hypothetical protein
MVSKLALIPDCTFVEEQFSMLAIPVTRDLKAGCFRKTVLNAVCWVARLLIAEKAVRVGSVTIGTIANIERVDNHSPASV